MNQDLILMTLLHRTHALGRRGKRKEPEVPRGSGRILEHLDTDRPVRPRELAEELGIRPQSVSEALLYLEKRGEIVRESDPQDKRSCLVTLSEAGKMAKERAAVERRERAEALFSPLTEEEKKTLEAILNKILEKGDR